MHEVVKPADCVNTATAQALKHKILVLVRMGFQPHAIADQLGCSKDYVRAVRWKAGMAGPSIGRRNRHRQRRRQTYPRQSNLRELALKLYAMRQEGLL